VKNPDGSPRHKVVETHNSKTGEDLIATLEPNGNTELRTIDKDGKETVKTHDVNSGVTTTEFPNGEKQTVNSDGSGTFEKKNGEEIRFDREQNWRKFDKNGNEIDRGSFEDLALEIGR
jgi:hypothetical protein